MRKLVVGSFLTLDGVMRAPSGPNEDPEGGFRHGGWLVPYFDEKFGEIMTEWTKRAGAFLLGRKTYEIFSASWPKSTDPADEIATALNTRPKFVASRTLDKVTWNNSHLLKGDVAEEVAKLKVQEGGEIQVHGSSDLLQTLLKQQSDRHASYLAVPCGCRHRQALVRRRHNPGQLPACRHTTDRYRCCPACVRACRRPQVRRSRSRPGDRDLRFGYSTQVTHHQRLTTGCSGPPIEIKLQRLAH